MLELILPPKQLFFLPHLFLLLLFLFFQQPRQKPGKHLQLPPCYVSDVYLLMPNLLFSSFYFFILAVLGLLCGVELFVVACCLSLVAVCGLP